MKHISLFSSFGAFLSFAQAAPANTRQAAPATIAESCTNAELRENWFLADCLTVADSSTRIKSAVFLPNKVENNDGDLKWKTEGEYRRSCKDCKITDNGATLTCTCNPAWGSSKKGPVTTTLKLDEHISVYNGHLLSNLAGAPQIPTTPSKYPMPSTFSWSFGGETTCPEADGPGTDDFCKKQVHGCTTSSNRTDTSDSAFFDNQPLTCFVPVIYFPQYHYQFEVFKFASEGAWEVLGYADEACTGEAVERVGPEDAGVCKSFRTRVRAVTVRPAFNGDAS